MGIMGGILGGVVGVEMASAVNGLLEKHGGLQGVITQLEQNGLGSTVKSWVGTGPNQPVTGAQLQSALGMDTIKQLADKVGIHPTELLGKLTAALPAAIDHLTPGGQVPTAKG